MKGIAEPIELFEVGEADALFVPPPDAAKGYRVVREGDVWLPARNIKHSLPAELDSFVGRRETLAELARRLDAGARQLDRKSTRLNSSHSQISYAVFCLKKKKKK